MLQRLIRIWLVSVVLFAGQGWALGLGDIRLSSALNEPLRAEIELLSASADELANLKIRLASADTFERYGLDRPLNLMQLQFSVSGNGQADGNVISVTSIEPIKEPFITFLVEAEWSRGRMLREYTLLLDPPTFAPAALSQPTQPLTAPSRSQPADSGTIQRPPATPAPAPSRPAPQPPVATPRADAAPAPAPQMPAPQADNFSSVEGGDYVVRRGDTLWKIADRFKPDNRLTMNQTMLAIFEENPQAFNGNINRLSSGATLRIPAADQIFRISRSAANAEAQRQNEAWARGTTTAGTTQPSLTLIPPDEEPAEVIRADEPPTAVEAPGPQPEAPAVAVPSDEQRIYEIEQLLQDHQDSIIEIEDDELAALRAELARLKGEEYVPPEVPEETEQPPVVEQPVITEQPAPTPPPQVVSVPEQESPGFFGSILSSLTGFWGILIGGLVIAVGALLWFARRAAQAPEDDSTGVWNALDADDVDRDTVASTQRLRALAQEDDSAIVVVEVDSQYPGEDRDSVTSRGGAPAAAPEPFIAEEPVSANDADSAADDMVMFDTLEAPASIGGAADFGADDSLDEILDDKTERPGDDTFSSDTAINFDESDPIAEADFHMAYGLYDQAADLINGALAIEPGRQDLLGKLCETYFVWGNRDAFVDAAARLRATMGDDVATADWDKIIIMGQQIAGDHEMFSGVSPGAGTRAVDLSLDGDPDQFAALDMDFAGGPDGAVSDVTDLGGDHRRDASTVVSDDSIDLLFGDDDISTSATREMPGALSADETAESPTVEQPSPDSTAETPTIDQQFDSLDATGEMASISEITGDNDDRASVRDKLPPDATAEIELDDLGLDLGGFAESQIDEMAGDDELLDIFGETFEETELTDDDDIDHLAQTSETPTLTQHIEADEFGETAESPALVETGKNPEIDVSDLGDAAISTGVHGIPDYDTSMDATGEIPALELPDATYSREAADETMEAEPSIEIDSSLLDATGQTQILTGDLAVEAERRAKAALADDEATMLAPRSDDDETMEAPADVEVGRYEDFADDAATMLASLDDDDADLQFNKTEALPKHAFTEFEAGDEPGEGPSPAGSTDMDLDLEDLTAALKVSEMQDIADSTLENTSEQPQAAGREQSIDPDANAGIYGADESDDLQDARTMTEVGTKLDLARAYVDMGDPDGARSILEEVLEEGDDSQRQQAQHLLDSLPG